MNVRQIWCRECHAPPGEPCTGIPKRRRNRGPWHQLRARDAILLTQPVPTDPRPLARRIADFNTEQEKAPR